MFGEGGNTTLAGRVHVRPAGAAKVSVTVPAKPFTAVTVMVDVPEPPASIWLGETAPADIVKSTTWKVAPGAVVWLSEPLEPVTVTVY